MRQEWCHGDNFNWRLFHAWIVREYGLGAKSRKEWLIMFLGEAMHEVVQRLRHMSIGKAFPSVTNTNDWLAFYLRNALGIKERVED